MTDSLILRSHEVRALLEHSKVLVVRPIRPQPLPQMLRCGGGITGLWCGWDSDDDEVWSDYCPLGTPGAQRWVKETWSRHEPLSWGDAEENDPFKFPPADRINGDERLMEYWRKRVIFRADNPRLMWPDVRCWRSSTQMPQWASRLTVENTGVRVIRMQEIGCGDIIAAGFAEFLTDPQQIDAEHRAAAQDAFAKDWGSHRSQYGFPWKSNPWIWAAMFRKVES